MPSTKLEITATLKEFSISLPVLNHFNHTIHTGKQHVLLSFKRKWSITVTGFLILQLLILTTTSAQKVDFKPSIDSGCSPLKVKFDDLSTGGGGIVSRSWDLDNNNPIITDSLSVQVNYNTPRTYNIKLVVTFANGIRDSLTKKVVVHPKPNPDFDADFTTACAPANIHFRDKSTTSTGTIATWTWNLDLSTSTAPNPDQVYTNTGSYRINLLVTNNWGCNNIISKPDFIKIVNKPQVGFLLDPQKTCNDTLTIFSKNTSTGAPEYLWDFGDGITSKLPEPSHFYTAPGSYTVRLSSVISPGCEDSKTTVVNIGKPHAEITSFPDTVCEKTDTRFIGRISPATASGYWMFADRNATVNSLQANYTFNNPGRYEVFFIAANSWGCTDTVKRSIYVRPKPVMDFTVSPQNTCNDSLTVFFTDNGTGALNLLWDFGDGSTGTQMNTSHFYASPGSYVLTIQELTSGCGSKISKPVNVGKPKAEIILFKDTVCKDQLVSFTGKITPSNLIGKWFFADKNQTLNGNQVNYTFSNTGTYDVFFIANNSWNCTDTVKKSIYVSPLPTPLFDIDTLRSCKTPFTIQTINQTSGTNLEFTWNFGDGKPAVKGFAPAYTYTSFGNFDVVLTAKDTSSTAGCAVSLIKRAVVHIINPSAVIIPGPFSNCNPPVNIAFTLTTANFIDAPVQYIWDYGDGIIDTTNAAASAHTFSTAGSFTVKVLIASGSGCTALASRSITILNTCPPPPDTVITVTSSCNPCNRITLRDTVVNSTVTKWEMGDGTIISANVTNPVTHLFPTGSASYKVTVERKNNITGITSRTSSMVDVLCLDPVITSDKTATCINDSIGFSTVHLDSSLIKEYLWEFEAGGRTQLINSNDPPYKNGSTRYAFKSTGTYSVRLTVTDNRGCRFISNSITIIIQGPKADFTSSPRTTCDSSFTVFFKDSTTLNNGIPIVKWEWNFGDGSLDYMSSNDTLISKLYKRNSIPVTSYNVFLKVTDSLGCSGSITRVKEISLYRPVAAFSSRDTLHCNDYLTTFQNESKAVNPTYSWYPGDGTMKNDVHLRYTYARDGIYDIKLVVKDENGCTDSTIKRDFIKIIKPVANMSITDSSECWPHSITFKDSSTYATRYLWDFGDGRSTAQDKERTRTYDGPGVYLVRLIITGPGACKDTASQQIRIKGSIGNAFIDDTLGCKPFTTTMRVLNRFNIVDYTWDFGDGSVIPSSPGDSIIQHTYKTEGKYVPSVIYTSSEACQNYDSTKPVIIDFATAKFSVSQSSICESRTATILDSSVAAGFSRLKNYLWDFGNGQTSGVPKPADPVYVNSGTYTIKLKVTSAFGCSDSLILPDIVNVYKKPLVSISGIDSSCQNTTAVFRAVIQSEDSISSVKWLLNGIEKGRGDSVTVTFNQAGQMDLALQVQTKHGCDVYLNKKVLIRPIPTPLPDTSPDTSICVNSTVQLRATDGVSYSWSPSATLLNPNTATPVARPLPGLTIYVVSVANVFGCVAKDSLSIRTDDSVFVTTLPTFEVCLDNTIILQATSNARQFVWSPADHLSNQHILMPSASPKTDTRYRLIGFSNNACPADTAFTDIKVHTLPSVKAAANPTKTIAGTYVKLSAEATGSNLNYNWQPASFVANPGSPVTEWKADNTRTFKITVTDQNNCSAADTVQIQVSCAANTVFVPNAFTPGKSVNNRLRPLSPYKNNPVIDRFEVYNRWGGIVYQVKGVRLNEITGWDGQLKVSNAQDPNGFPWLLTMDCDGIPVIKKGTAILIR